MIFYNTKTDKSPVHVYLDHKLREFQTTASPYNLTIQNRLTLLPMIMEIPVEGIMIVIIIIPGVAKAVLQVCKLINEKIIKS